MDGNSRDKQVERSQALQTLSSQWMPQQILRLGWLMGVGRPTRISHKFRSHLQKLGARIFICQRWSCHLHKWNYMVWIWKCYIMMCKNIKPSEQCAENSGHHHNNIKRHGNLAQEICAEPGYRYLQELLASCNIKFPQGVFQKRLGITMSWSPANNSSKYFKLHFEIHWPTDWIIIWHSTFLEQIFIQLLLRSCIFNLLTFRIKRTATVYNHFIYRVLIVLSETGMRSRWQTRACIFNSTDRWVCCEQNVVLLLVDSHIN
jgi:hypothetical protein